MSQRFSQLLCKVYRILTFLSSVVKATWINLQKRIWSPWWQEPVLFCSRCMYYRRHGALHIVSMWEIAHGLTEWIAVKVKKKMECRATRSSFLLVWNTQCKTPKRIFWGSRNLDLSPGSPCLALAEHPSLSSELSWLLNGTEERGGEAKQNSCHFFKTTWIVSSSFYSWVR